MLAEWQMQPVAARAFGESSVVERRDASGRLSTPRALALNALKCHSNHSANIPRAAQTVGQRPYKAANFGSVSQCLSNHVRVLEHAAISQVNVAAISRFLRVYTHQCDHPLLGNGDWFGASGLIPRAPV